MDVVEKRLKDCLGILGQAVNPIHLIRPANVACYQISLPGPDLGETLRIDELGSIDAKLFFEPGELLLKLKNLCFEGDLSWRWHIHFGSETQFYCRREKFGGKG